MASLNWKPLPAFGNFPPLLVRPEFTAQSYTVHVTDLANLWVESLDRKGVGKRSLNEDTSIDPTEGPDQMVLLLTKIQAALDPSAPDYDQTSASLAASPRGDEDSLALTIACPLPDGLAPLKWTFLLTRCPFVSVAPQLVLPLVQAQHDRNREIAQLISSLRDKDAVIEKLVDKLENVGISLENVFNVSSGKRKPSRELAAEKVVGLAPFRESDWRAKPLASTERAENIILLIDEVFSMPLHYEDMGISTSDSLSDWWSKLDSKPISGTQRMQKKRDTKAPKETQDGPQLEEPRLAADGDDDFQVQATPPQLESGRKRRTVVDVDATTDDEAEAIPDSHPTPVQPARTRLATRAKGEIAESLPSSRPSQHKALTETDTASESDAEPAKTPPRLGKVGRLGKIGRKPGVARIGAAESEAKSPCSAPQKPKTDEDTATESDEEAPAKATPPESLGDAQVPKRKLGTIGRIRGNSRQGSVPLDDGPKSPEAAPVKSAGRRIGAIGKRKAEDNRSDTQPSSQIAEEAETEEQKAERKRADLAKELERKAAAKPVKKKRKF